MKPWHGIDGNVLADFFVENMASRDIWGEQNHPLGISQTDATEVYEETAKAITHTAAEKGEVTWRHIVEEEFAEFLNASSDDRAYQELVQLANVALLAAESIKRKRRRQWQARQESQRGAKVQTAKPVGGVL